MSVTVGQAPPDDGVAEPGMLVTIRYEIDGITDHFLMADYEEAVDDNHWTCSPESPLGTVLDGARVGDRLRYRLPTGEMTAITLLNAVPYRAKRAPVVPEHS